MTLETRNPCQPCDANDFLSGHAELLLATLLRLTGRTLVDPALSGRDRFRALFEAPFAVVSHNTDADPVFNYGNEAALKLFEMSWDDFTKLPSRLSAEKPLRDERERLLERVRRLGYIDDYTGVRVSSTGRRFFVQDAVVWNMVDEGGIYRGQAAALFAWKPL